MYTLFFIFNLLFLGSMTIEVSAAIGGRTSALVGGWKPISDPKDKYVVEIGQYAINEHNKEAKSELKFESILKGEQQVVAGTNYKLYIAENDTGNSHQYEAVFYDQPWRKLRSLTYFKQVA